MSKERLEEDIKYLSSPKHILTEYGEDVDFANRYVELMDVMNYLDEIKDIIDTAWNMLDDVEITTLGDINTVCRSLEDLSNKLGEQS